MGVELPSGTSTIQSDHTIYSGPDIRVDTDRSFVAVIKREVILKYDYTDHTVDLIVWRRLIRI